MSERSFKHAVIYSLDVETFQDSNGDGVGDIASLIARLDYLARLGVTCIWLHPIHPSPDRDDGCDVADYYATATSGRRPNRRGDGGCDVPRRAGAHADQRPRDLRVVVEVRRIGDGTAVILAWSRI
jgi:hypothetical protein